MYSAIVKAFAGDNFNFKCLRKYASSPSVAISSF
jgi:hypothetical protein